MCDYRFLTLFMCLQVDALCRQHAALKAKAGQRQKEIASGQKGLEQLTEALNAAAQGITKASADVDAMSPIAGEVTAIKALQDELKVCVELFAYQWVYRFGDNRGNF